MLYMFLAFFREIWTATHMLYMFLAFFREIWTAAIKAEWLWYTHVIYVSCFFSREQPQSKLIESHLFFVCDG